MNHTQVRIRVSSRWTRRHDLHASGLGNAMTETRDEHAAGDEQGGASEVTHAAYSASSVEGGSIQFTTTRSTSEPFSHVHNDRLHRVFAEHTNRVIAAEKLKGDWVTPAAAGLSTLTALITADFQALIISAREWRLLFIILTIGFAVRAIWSLGVRRKAKPDTSWKTFLNDVNTASGAPTSGESTNG
jgi:hypothetical protein